MTTPDYQSENIYRYARTTYKNGKGEHSYSQDDRCMDSGSPGRDRADEAGCSSIRVGDDIASILHKKCPVVALARQQLQRVLDDTEQLLIDSNRSCRSLTDFLHLLQELCVYQNKCTCILILLIGLAFVVGIVIGAASCGSYLGQFNSPIMTCLENRLSFRRLTNMETYHGIV